MEVTPSLVFSSLNIFSAAFLWIIFAVSLIFFAVVSTVLVYHWRRYALNKVVAQKAVTIYFSVSGLLFFFLLISLILS